MLQSAVGRYVRRAGLGDDKPQGHAGWMPLRLYRSTSNSKGVGAGLTPTSETAARFVGAAYHYLV